MPSAVSSPAIWTNRPSARVERQRMREQPRGAVRIPLSLDPQSANRFKLSRLAF